MMINTRLALCFAVAALAVANSGCVATADRDPARLTHPKPVSEDDVAELMETQRRMWNDGDLAGFVSYYDESMTFCGSGGVTRGTDNLLDHYKKSYPTAKERGTLTFEVLEVRPFGTHEALVLGKYHIAREEPASGYFSLIVQRAAEGLRILHDHTSASEKSH